MRFTNPKNGYTEDKSVPWLWVLLFGPIYFLASGMFAAAILWVLLLVGAAVLLGEPALLVALATLPV